MGDKWLERMGVDYLSICRCYGIYTYIELGWVALRLAGFFQISMASKGKVLKGRTERDGITALVGFCGILLLSFKESFCAVFI